MVNRDYGLTLINLNFRMIAQQSKIANPQSAWEPAGLKPVPPPPDIIDWRRHNLCQRMFYLLKGDVLAQQAHLFHLNKVTRLHLIEIHPAGDRMTVFILATPADARVPVEHLLIVNAIFRPLQDDLVWTQHKPEDRLLQPLVAGPISTT